MFLVSSFKSHFCCHLHIQFVSIVLLGAKYYHLPSSLLQDRTHGWGAEMPSCNFIEIVRNNWLS
jgi:hypothetical protein